MTAFSLLDTPWLPVIRLKTGRDIIRPAEITANIDEDPVVGFAWPRADFRIASHEFLIGLLAISLPPEDPEQWLEGWQSPPSPEEIDAALRPLAHAFLLDGDGPRFMQDLEDLDNEAKPIETLLIEAPGGQTTRKNADLFVKRGYASRMSRATAAISLYTLQTYAPEGGRGNLTGLRGGGPLTTLVVPYRPEGPTLWHTIWANVPFGRRPEEADLGRILPWLDSTITSEDGRTVAPGEEEPDPLSYWSMPRRIRLDFTDTGADDACDVTGASDEVIVRTWRQKGHGAKYTAFRHPLTPYYRKKAADPEWFAVHPGERGIGYQDYLGLVFEASETSQIALAVSEFRSRKLPEIADGYRVWRILAAGFDTDNMKVRSFVEAEMPVHEPDEPEQREAMVARVRSIIAGSGQVLFLLRGAVRSAIVDPRAPDPRKKSSFVGISNRYWEETAPAFWSTLEALAADPAADGSRLFLTAILPVVWQIFEDCAPILETDRPDRIAKAQRNLSFELRGYGPGGKKLFSAFGLPLPKTSGGKAARGKAREVSA